MLRGTTHFIVVRQSLTVSNNTCFRNGKKPGCAYLQKGSAACSRVIPNRICTALHPPATL